MALLFVLPGLLGFTLFYIWPFFISLGYAFVDKPVDGTFVGFSNYISLFQNSAYVTGLKNMAWFIGVGTPLNIIMSLLAALLINRTGKRKDLFALIFLIPLVIPSGSMVFFWKSFFAYNGYLNYLLGLMEIPRVNWLESSNARFVIVFIFIWKNLGYNMVLFLAGLNNIPKDYYEVARVFGANKIQSFFYVTAANLLPSLVLCIIMSIINSFKVFKEIYLITGSYPHTSIYTMQHYMNNMFFSLNYQKLSAATSTLVIIVSVLTQLLFKFERKVSA